MGAIQAGFGGDSLQVNDILIGVAPQQGAGGAGSGGLSGYPSLSGGKIKLSGLNFNATNGTDIATVTVYLPNGVTLFQLEGIGITNASHTLATATISVNTGAGATGTALLGTTSITVASSTVGAANSAQFTAGVTTVNAQSTINTSNGANTATIYVNLVAQEGAAATADVYLYIRFF